MGVSDKSLFLSTNNTLEGATLFFFPFSFRPRSYSSTESVAVSLATQGEEIPGRFLLIIIWRCPMKIKILYQYKL